MSRNAMPVLIAGVVGLVSGLLAVALAAPAFGVVAGILALASAFGAMRLGRALDEQSAVQVLVEDELRKVRADAEEAQGQIVRLKASLTDSSTAAAEREDAFYDDGDDTDPLTDIDTGLFSESFFRVALESRVAAARRHLRPVSVVIMQVMEGVPSSNPRPAGAEVVATAIKDTLREADTACRLRNGDFALLLEDTPENGAIWTVERVRRRLMDEPSSTLEHPPTINPSTIDVDGFAGSDQPATNAVSNKLTVWAGVACYPAHAFSTYELLNAAATALHSAQEWHQDRIEVAVPAPD